MTGRPLFACVPNVSEGRDLATLDACAAAIVEAGALLAHRTHDAVHHRAVFTFLGDASRIEAAALALAHVAVARIDLRRHRGAHPRIGALDVLPVVPVRDATPEDAAMLARSVAASIATHLDLPVFFYDAASRTGRRLPEVRRGGFERLASRLAAGDRFDVGGPEPHPSAGAIAVGARDVLVAFNVVLGSGDVTLARRIARTIRESGGGVRSLRAIGVDLHDGRVQVSCNLTDVAATPIDFVVELVGRLAARDGVRVVATETIGLVPRAALRAAVDAALRRPTPWHGPNPTG